MSKLKSTRPPWLGRLLSRLIIGTGADELRGDLDESYRRRVEQRGDSFGVRTSYVFDVLLSVGHWQRGSARSALTAANEDVRYSARMLVKNPGFTLVAAISLAIGIGATTTVFGLVSAALFRPLPVKDPASLVTINKRDKDAIRIHHIAYPDYLDYRARTDIFSDLVAWTEASVNVDVAGELEPTYGIIVSGNYFSVLGIAPAVGRLLTVQDDQSPGEHPVTVLSFAFWQRRFGGDPAIVGKRVELNGLSYTVVGVAPKAFTSTYNVFAPAVYVPLAMQPQLTSRANILTSRGNRGLKLTGRLKPGVTREQAEAAITLLDQQIEQEYHPPRAGEPRRPNLGVQVVSVGSYPLDVQLALLGAAGLVLSIAGCVLLIACANVAAMLLARATARRREMAVRSAMGASRGRLIRQLLTEAVVLFIIAGTLGVALTMWLTRLVTTISMPVAMPFALDASVDWRVLSFTLALSLLTGVIFGLAPALENARVDLQTGLKDGAPASGLKRSRLRHAFVVGQIALSLVLLIAAGLFARALRYAQTVYPGHDPESVWTATFNPEPFGYTVPQARELYKQLMDRVGALPGVEAVSVTRELQIGMEYGTTSVVIKDAAQLGDQRVESNTIGPSFFRTLGVRLVSGREFTFEDRQGAPRVVIINESMARRYWPNASPLHRQVQLSQDVWAQIIGVVEDGRFRVAGQAAAPLVYGPYLQSGSNNSGMTLIVRYRGDKTTLLNEVRRETQALDRRLAIQAPMTLAALVDLVTLPWRIAGKIAEVFGFIGLALAAMGIYGLVAYTVNQRTREIGVRVALGADPGSIRQLFLGQGLRLALLGIAIGLVLAFGATQALASFLFGVSAADPMTYLAQALLLVIVATIASYLPARRATATDPMLVLRNE
jgi:predicted permease